MASQEFWDRREPGRIGGKVVRVSLVHLAVSKTAGHDNRRLRDILEAVDNVQ